MDKPARSDFDPYRTDDEDMKLIEGRDPWTVLAVLLNIVVTVVGVGWVSGRNDQRMATAERDIIELKAKADKDGQQDVQIATISTQLANIQSGVGEIKARLERK